MKDVTIKKTVDHQDIGGKRFAIDEEITNSFQNPEDVYIEAATGNIACLNFVARRPDYADDPYKFKYKLYYGKVGNLGYIVAEDEFENRKEK